jgi:type I restriction enzyme, S subunit
MKITWQTKRLGDLSSIRTGKKDVNEGNPNGKYPFFTCAREHTFSDAYSFDTEALLIAGNGDVGHVSYYNGKFEAYQRTYVLSDFINVLPQYLYLYLDGFLKDTVSKQKLGNTMPYIKMRMLTDFNVPLPPINEQKRLVKKLDEVFEKVTKAKEVAEKNLQNSKELFESYLNGVFANPGKDWEEKRLGDVCDTGAGGTPLKSHKDYYSGGDIPWLRSGEVDKKDIVKSELFITKKGLENSSARLFPKDTVLVAMYGATAGQVGILRFESTTNQAVCGILPNKDFVPEFIYYVFSAKKVELVKQAVGGAQPNISQIKIKNTIIPVPDLAQQKELVKKLNSMSVETERLEKIYEQKLADLEELKKSILSKAFHAEL